MDRRGGMRRLARRRSPLVLLALLGFAPTAAAQLEPPATGGAVALDRLLQRLVESRRVLVIGAHPDDEDTGLLALMARGRGAEAAYLSLSRGEGGQNLLGAELGVDLGLLRSRELEAARAVDGASQFFARAYDFGYTRSLEETERLWLPDSLLKDVVRAVRRFRPHVIVAVFSGTARDGHGQHRLSALLAHRAFAVAGDPAVFPELTSGEGLQPWTALTLYRSTRFDTAATTVALETGGLDPRSGYTFHQIAMASRSRHRSQDFGVLQPTGPARVRFELLESRVRATPEGDLFAGIPPDTTWLSLLADSLRRHLPAARPEDAAPPLAAALHRARAEAVPEERLRLLEQALAVAAGIVVDAVADDADLVVGQTVDIRIEVYNGGPYPVTVEQAAVRVGRSGAAPAGGAEQLTPGGLVTFRCSALVDSAVPLTQPYFLTRPHTGALYDWRDARPEERGLPFGKPVVEAELNLSLLGVRFRVAREVVHRFADQAVGEIRQPIRVVPLLDVSLDPDRLVWSSLAADSQPFTVTVRHNGRDPLVGSVELSADGWTVPAAQRFAFERGGERATLTFVLRRPAVARAAVTVRAVARTDGGATFAEGVQTIAYPHIRPVSRTVPAEADVRVAPIALPAARLVGYVRGASDRVPEALGRIELPLELLTEETLARGDLSRFGAIVVGSRAYETDSALVRHNGRLLEYVRRGGLLVVQYQQYPYVRGGFAPYPLEIAFPHDRVTDETAPVLALVPDHAALRRPNPIGPEDWEGWPQERGLYFARAWDEAYVPLLEMADPGGPPLRGGLLVARFGAGTYVYTGLSFFRALPAGVVGAHRVFLNLLALRDE